MEKINNIIIRALPILCPLVSSSLGKEIRTDIFMKFTFASCRLKPQTITRTYDILQNIWPF